MADPLMVLSLQPHPFLIFSSSLNRRWGLSRSGIRFSVSEFRLRTSQLQLSNSTSPSQSSSSSTAPEKLDLVSSTQLKDGSHVFRFGDATEVERYLESEEKARCFELEKKQRGKIAEEGVKDGHALVDLDPVSELESPKEKSAVKRKTVKSSTETVSEKEEKAVHASLSSVIKIKDRKRVRSPVKKKKETSSTVDVLGSGDEVEAKVANSIVSVAEAIPTSSTEEKTNENVEPLSSEVMEKVSVNEIRDCETNGYNQLTESRVEEQAGPGSSSSEHDSQLNDLKEVIKVSTVELDENLEEMENLMKTFEAEENLVVEPTATVAVSTDELVVVSPEENHVVEPTATVALSPDELVDVSPEENLVVEPTATVAVSTDELVVVSPEEDLVVEPTATVAVTPDELVDVPPEENLVVEPTATVAVSPDELVVTSPDELISTSEATNHSVEEIAETPVIDTSEVANDEENVASTIEGEVVVIDSKNDNGSISKTVNDTNDEDLQLPEPETAGLQPIEVASDREELVSKSFYLESGSASLQNPNKALAGREDAYFISDNNNWLGVADGVSQWSFEGISEGMYAQELMSNCEKIISDETAEICDDPVHVLHRSVNETKSSGSSTALIAHLSNNELHIANIGDSGFMVVRNRTVLQKSSPMFHHFCFPLHITRGDDILKLAEVYHVNLEEGDVVITASDGLFDNLYEKEIVSIVCRLLEQGLEPQQRIAELVAAKAQEVGRSETERTPFGDAAKEEGHDGYRGGKLDAVTVIVSLVKTVSI
ncbi:probable protein phosphatase 2C 62 isoform X1 [Brassica rapa]|uniref:probable protein phosphatase 2C 62 isoform X1 n=1 Tax=Brassica campestris TaxID=3711 RepID=UPI00142E7464|nr:probable protein phosphatase 2C 62 isoform X1 [Brassica rapa]